MDEGAVIDADLIAGHRLRLFRFTLKCVGRVDDAEDLAQRTMLTALEVQQRFTGASSLTTWLFGIAVNHINEYRRARRRQDRMDGDDALELLPCADDDPAMALSRHQDVQTMRAAIQSLAAPLRDIIVLVSLEDLSYETAAAVLGVPIGTVRSRLHRAKKKLRDYLAANEPLRADTHDEGASATSVKAYSGSGNARP